MEKAEPKEILGSGKIVFFPDFRAAVLSYNGKEEVNVRLYSSQKELWALGLIGGFLKNVDGKKNKILYSGKLKHFNKFDYGDKKVDEKKINSDNDKMYKAILQLGGDMESHILVSKYYTPEKTLEEISFNQAEELVKNKKAEFKWFGHEKDFFLAYGETLYFRNNNKKTYCL